MWSKSVCRSSFALKGYCVSASNIPLHVCRCLSGGSQLYRHERHSSSSGGAGQGTYWSRAHLHLTTVLAGLGVTLAGYKIFKRSLVVHAAETKDVNAENKNSEEKPEIDWSKVPKVPKHVKYLLIGGGVASLEAFIAIKTQDMNAQVLMIGEEPYTPYIRPPLSKSFWFDKNKENYKDKKYTSLMGQEKSVFLYEGLYMKPQKLPYSERGGLAWLQGKVVKLDSVLKNVTLKDGTVISYDKCLIATGGRPRQLPVLQEAGTAVKKRVTLFRNLNDMIKLIETTDKCKSVAVIGGGFLGSELAVGLATRGADTGLKVFQVYPEKGNMARVLPEYLSEWTSKKIREEGVEIIPQSEVVSAVVEDNQVKLRLSDNKFIKVDHIVVAVGLEPNTDLAESADLEVDELHGGYRVNLELQARSDIWVAGDCSCFYDVKLGRRRVEHYDHACLTGRLAGFNMTGESRPYTHQSAYWSDLGRQISYEAVGLTDSKLKTFSVFRNKLTQEEKDRLEELRKLEQTRANSTTLDDTMNPTTNNKSVPDASKTTTKSQASSDESKALEQEAEIEEVYEAGVVFYLQKEVIVGIVLWNLSGYSGEPSRLDIARQVIANGKKRENLVEVAKLFNIYEI